MFTMRWTICALSLLLMIGLVGAEETDRLEQGAASEPGGSVAQEHVDALSPPSASANDAADGTLDDAMLELGPIVVREDGTMGRLKDWPKMTSHERVAVLKTVQRRNAQRRQRLEEL